MERPIIGVLRARYKYIKEELHPSDKIVDVLYQEKFLRRKSFEVIAGHTRSEDPSRGIDILVKDLVRHFKSLGDSQYGSRVSQLFEKFEENGCKYLLEAKVKKDDDDAIDLPEVPSSILQCLLQSTKNWKLLKENLEPKHIIDDLLVHGTLSFDDHEDIVQQGHRPVRVDYLMTDILSDVASKGPPFLASIRSLNPKLGENLWKNLESTTQTGNDTFSLQEGPGRRRVIIEGPIAGDSEITIKLKFSASQIEIVSVEQSIASSPITTGQQEAAMEWESSVESISFSSVVVKLKMHSTRALTLVTQRLSHPELLKKWLNSLLTAQQKQELTEAGWDSLSVEIKTVPRAMTMESKCHCHILKHAFSDESTDLLTSLVSRHLNIDIIMSKVYAFNCTSHNERRAIQRIMNLSNDNQKLVEFLELFRALDDGKCCALERAITETNQDFQDHLLKTAQAPLHDDDVTHSCRYHDQATKCTSILSRTVIKAATEDIKTQPITDIERFLRHIEDVEEGLNDTERDTIRILSASADSIEMTNNFLELLPQLPRSCICRFEMFLKDSDQNNILCRMKLHNKLIDAGDVTKNEIRENITYLCKQINPKLFHHILQQSDRDSLPTLGNRTDRCLAFFTCMLESDNCDVYIRKFVAVLDELKIFNVKQILTSSKGAKNLERARVYEDIQKHKLLDNKAMILDEVDVTTLKSTFVDRGILSEQEFDVICDQESRKASTLSLLNTVLGYGYTALVCFVDALKIGGYGFVAGTIKNTPAQVLPCPCIQDRGKPETLIDATFSVYLKEPCGTKRIATPMISVEPIHDRPPSYAKSDVSETNVNTCRATYPASTHPDDLNTTEIVQVEHGIAIDDILETQDKSSSEAEPNDLQADMCDNEQNISSFLPNPRNCSLKQATVTRFLKKSDEIDVAFHGSDRVAKSYTESRLKEDGHKSFDQDKEIPEITSNKKRHAKERSNKGKGGVLFEYLNLGFTPRPMVSVREYVNDITWTISRC